MTDQEMDELLEKERAEALGNTRSRDARLPKCSPGMVPAWDHASAGSHVALHEDMKVGVHAGPSAVALELCQLASDGTQIHAYVYGSFEQVKWLLDTWAKQLAEVEMEAEFNVKNQAALRTAREDEARRARDAERSERSTVETAG